MKGSVRKRKDGRWEGRVELPPIAGKRKQKYVYADRRQECQRLVNEIIHDIETGSYTDSGKMTINKYMDDWLERQKKLAETTKEGYKSYIKNHINKYFYDKKLKSLLPKDIEDFYNYERDLEYAEKTILQIHRILSRAFNDAAKNRLIPYNPCTLIDAPSPQEFKPDVPEIELYYEILEKAAGTRHELPIMLAGLCGLRRSEVFGLTANDVDFENCTITVRQVVVVAGNNVIVKPPKNKKSARTIAVPEEVIEILKKTKAVGFICNQEGNMVNPGFYGVSYRRFLKTRKFPHIRFHDLRHFHATLLLDSGVDIREAMARLGHSNINQTEHYTHIRRKPKADFKTVEKMSDFIKTSRAGQTVGQKQKTNN